MSGVTAVAIGLGAASIASAGIGAVASNSAANKQVNAAKSAQQLQADEATQALDFQKQEYSDQEAREQPYLTAGNGALNALSTYQPFAAPTLAEAQATPGYQFTLQQGTQAIDANAAATGNLLSGNTGVSLEKYGEGLADSTYNDVYNRALQTYDTNLGKTQELANVGLTAAGQMGSQGQAAANNIANTNLTTGAQQGQDLTNAGTAAASGIAGVSNSLTGGLNSLSTLALLNGLQQGTQSGYGSATAQANGPSPYLNPDGSYSGI